MTPLQSIEFRFFLPFYIVVFWRIRPIKKLDKKYETSLTPTDFATKKRRDSDWIILTARHFTVYWALRI